MYTVPHFIQGKNITQPGPAQQIFNPATGQVIGQAFLAQADLVNQAVQAAKSALTTWSTTSPSYRAAILVKFRNLVDQHLDEIAHLITQEHGKTLNDARASIERGIDVLAYACDITNHLRGNFSLNIATDVDSYSLRQPLGVCVGITPFNFPAMIALWMFPLAIACGNTFVLKPSEKDPSAVVRLAELITEAGLPPGVLNVIQGNAETVQMLIKHPDTRAISFVGSTSVAENVYKMATQVAKRVQAFGGAKNHAVIMPDADLDLVTHNILTAAYGSAGERCMAISVVVAIGDSVADALVHQLKPKIESLRVGPGDQPNIDMGPLITREHWQKVNTYVEQGIQEGAVLVVDNRHLASLSNSHGFYMGGCLFDYVEPQMRIYREEIFGPVLSIVRVADLESALRLINEHTYGNGTAIFTQRGDIARTFASRVQVGMVGINVPIPVPAAYYSFGGWKHSMFGDIHMYGAEGIQFYTRLKTVVQRWPNVSSTLPGFIMPTLK